MITASKDNFHMDPRLLWTYLSRCLEIYIFITTLYVHQSFSKVSVHTSINKATTIMCLHVTNHYDKGGVEGRSKLCLFLCRGMGVSMIFLPSSPQWVSPCLSSASPSASSPSASSEVCKVTATPSTKISVSISSLASSSSSWALIWRKQR